jgi:hypothetical protein
VIPIAATRQRRGLTWSEVVIWFSGRVGWHFKLLPLQQRAAHLRVKLLRTPAQRLGMIRIPGPSTAQRGKLNFILSRRRERTTRFSRVASRAETSPVTQDSSRTSTMDSCTVDSFNEILTSYVPTGHSTSGSRSM